MKIAKKDIRHLDWIYERMRTAHNENHNFDYMIAFRRIIDGLYKEYEDYHKPQPDLPAPNTVMWWLCRIADPEIRRKAVGTFNQFRLYEDSITLTCIKDCNEAIDHIDWDQTGPDAYMWEEMWKTPNIPLLPEPDFTEYNELRKC